MHTLSAFGICLVALATACGELREAPSQAGDGGRGACLECAPIEVAEPNAGLVAATQAETPPDIGDAAAGTQAPIRPSMPTADAGMVSEDSLALDAGTRVDATVAAPGVDLIAVTYGAGQFIATGFVRTGVTAEADGTPVIYASPDAVDWSRVADVPEGNPSHVAFGNNRFVVLTGLFEYEPGRDVNPQWTGAMSSTDGRNWTTTRIADTYSIGYPSLAFGDGVFTATTEGGHLYQSVDGIEWSEGPEPGFSELGTSVTFAGGRHLVWAPYEKDALLQVDGAWQPIVIETGDERPFRLYADHDRFFAITYLDWSFGEVAGARSYGMAASDDGATWTEVPFVFPEGEPPVVVLQDPQTCIALRFDAVFSGPTCDALSQTFHEPPFYTGGAAAGAGAYVVVGSESTVLRSEDGVSWTKITLPIDG